MDLGINLEVERGGQGLTWGGGGVERRGLGDKPRDKERWTME